MFETTQQSFNDHCRDEPIFDDFEEGYDLNIEAAPLFTPLPDHDAETGKVSVSTQKVHAAFDSSNTSPASSSISQVGSSKDDLIIVHNENDDDWAMKMKKLGLYWMQQKRRKDFEEEKEGFEVEPCFEDEEKSGMR